MATDWRTIQLFLSDTGVDEVSADVADPKHLRCTCRKYGWMHLTRCKHEKFILNKLKKHDGIYPVEVPEDISEDVMHEALESPANFRAFIVSYAKIETV